VRRGDPIGEVGMTGVATGPHLHWAVYVHGIAVSPLFWTRLPR
jgi:murein DD-endopeptidase MepM/ murein hydrolase activator NlpD